MSKVKNRRISLEKLRCRLRRLRLPKAYRHMYKINPKFQVITTEGGRQLLWAGRPIRQLLATSSLRNRESGAGYILASGPSVRDIPADTLARHAARMIAVNGAISLFKDAGTFPAYCAATDTDFIINRIDLIEEILRNDCIFFVSSEGLSYICAHNIGVIEEAVAQVAIIDVVNKQYFQPQIDDALFRKVHSSSQLLAFSDKNPKLGFSFDISMGVFCGKTITYRAVQIAYHLGFRDIYLLGMDLGGARFYQEAQARPSRLDKDYERAILPSFAFCSSLAKLHDFRVVNLSTGSRLPESVLAKQEWRDIL